MNEVYFDNNATTLIDPAVAERINQLLREDLVNPASQHRAGRRALHVIEEARSAILAAVDAPPGSQVIFTSGGTEANNLAMFGISKRRAGPILVGATEHPSVLDAAASADGRELVVLPVNQHGIIDLQFLEERLSETYASGGQVSVVSVMLGNNETGILQDLPPIASLCDRYGIPLHSDIVQAVGKVPFSMRESGLSAITITAHKMHGPVGIGALIAAPSLELAPVLVGGGQQLGVRPGTEPVLLAAALAETLQQICGFQAQGGYQRVAAMRDAFEKRVTELTPSVVIGADSPRLPHTSNIAFLGIDRQALYMALDLHGLACSTGSACASGSPRPSRVLRAMGLPDDVVAGSIRFSLSRFSTDQQVEDALEILSRSLSGIPLQTG